MRKKKLIERIEKLEKVVEFLSEHNKNEVVFGVLYNLYSLDKYTITYLHKGELKHVILGDIYCKYKVVKKSADYIIIKDGVSDRYYQIDREKATYELIPKPAFVLEKELAEKEASAKSSAKKSTEKKSSK